MGKQAETAKTLHCRKSTRSSSPEESSSFSVASNHMIQRKNVRKQRTHIIHTFCFFHKNSDGSIIPCYYQITAESLIRDQNTLRNIVLRQV